MFTRMLVVIAWILAQSSGADIVHSVTAIAVILTDIIHALTIVVGIAGLSIWGMAQIARPLFPDLAKNTSGYIRSIVFDEAVVVAGATVLKIIAGTLSW